MLLLGKQARRGLRFAVAGVLVLWFRACDRRTTGLSINKSDSGWEEMLPVLAEDVES